MATYAILIYEDFGPNGWADAPPEILDGHGAFAEKIQELGGKTVEGKALNSVSTAKSIRDGKVSDGSVVETSPNLMATNVIEARDLDHAVEIAKHCPLTDKGAVEVREAF